LGIAREEAFGKLCFEIFHANICEHSCALKETMETSQNIISKNKTMHEENGHYHDHGHSQTHVHEKDHAGFDPEQLKTLIPYLIKHNLDHVEDLKK
jgi:hypothetical protein